MLWPCVADQEARHVASARAGREGGAAVTGIPKRKEVRPADAAGSARKPTVGVDERVEDHVSPAAALSRRADISFIKISIPLLCT